MKVLEQAGLDRKTLILFSGGADSVLMLLMALRMGRTITALLFDYGQKHVEELAFAQKLLQKLKSEGAMQGHLIGEVAMNIASCFKRSRSNLLEDTLPASYPGVHNMHVPARNGVFLMTALGVAESEGFDEVWIGCDYSDRVNSFPDCYQEWILRMDDVAQRQHSRPIAVRAPLLGLTKEMVLDLLRAEEGLDLSEVFSGYKPPEPSATPPKPTA